MYLIYISIYLFLLINNYQSQICGLVDIFPELNILDQSDVLRASRNFGQQIELNQLTVFGWFQFTQLQKNNPILKTITPTIDLQPQVLYELFYLQDDEQKGFILSFIKNDQVEEIFIDTQIQIDEWFQFNISIDLNKQQIFIYIQNIDRQITQQGSGQIQNQAQIVNGINFEIGCFLTQDEIENKMNLESCSKGFVNNLYFTLENFENLEYFYLITQSKPLIDNYVFNQQYQDVVTSKNTQQQLQIQNQNKIIEQNLSFNTHLTYSFNLKPQILLSPTFVFQILFEEENITNHTLLLIQTQQQQEQFIQEFMININQNNNILEISFLQNNNILQQIQTQIILQQYNMLIFSIIKYNNQINFFAKINDEQIYISQNFQIQDFNFSKLSINPYENQNTLKRINRFTFIENLSGIITSDFRQKQSVCTQGCNIYSQDYFNQRLCLNCSQENVFIAQLNQCLLFCPKGSFQLNNICTKCQDKQCSEIIQPKLEVIQTDDKNIFVVNLSNIEQANFNGDNPIKILLNGQTLSEQDFQINQIDQQNAEYILDKNLNGLITFDFKDEILIYDSNKNQIQNQQISFEVNGEEDGKQLDENFIQVQQDIKDGIQIQPQQQINEGILIQPVLPLKDDRFLQIDQPQQEDVIIQSTQPQQEDIIMPPIQPQQEDIIIQSTQPKQEDIIILPVQSQQEDLIIPSIQPQQEDVINQPIQPIQDDILIKPIQPQQEDVITQPIQPQKEDIILPPIDTIQQEEIVQSTLPIQEDIIITPSQPTPQDIIIQPIQPQQENIINKPLQPIQEDFIIQPISPIQEGQFSLPVQPFKQDILIKPKQKDLFIEPIKPIQDNIIQNNDQPIQQDIFIQPVAPVQSGINIIPQQNNIDNLIQEPISPLQQKVIILPSSTQQEIKITQPISPQQEIKITQPISPQQEIKITQPISPQQEIKITQPTSTSNQNILNNNKQQLPQNKNQNEIKNFSDNDKKNNEENNNKNKIKQKRDKEIEDTFYNIGKIIFILFMVQFVIGLLRELYIDRNYSKNSFIYQKWLQVFQIAQYIVFFLCYNINLPYNFKKFLQGFFSVFIGTHDIFRDSIVSEYSDNKQFYKAYMNQQYSNFTDNDISTTFIINFGLIMIIQIAFVIISIFLSCMVSNLKISISGKPGCCKVITTYLYDQFIYKLLVTIFILFAVEMGVFIFYNFATDVLQYHMFGILQFSVFLSFIYIMFIVAVGMILLLNTENEYLTSDIEFMLRGVKEKGLGKKYIFIQFLYFILFSFLLVTLYKSQQWQAISTFLLCFFMFLYIVIYKSPVKKFYQYEQIIFYLLILILHIFIILLAVDEDQKEYTKQTRWNIGYALAVIAIIVLLYSFIVVIIDSFKEFYQYCSYKQIDRQIENINEGINQEQDIEQNRILESQNDIPVPALPLQNIQQLQQNQPLDSNMNIVPQNQIEDNLLSKEKNKGDQIKLKQQQDFKKKLSELKKRMLETEKKIEMKKRLKDQIKVKRFNQNADLKDNFKNVQKLKDKEKKLSSKEISQIIKEKQELNNDDENETLLDINQNLIDLANDILNDKNKNQFNLN